MASTISARMRQRIQSLIRPLAIRVIVARERLTTGVGWNPLSRAYQQDPTPTYRRLLLRRPIHRSRLLGAWVLSRFEDIDAVLRDHRRFGNDERKVREQRHGPHAVEQTPSMLLIDPPDHTRLRSLVSQAFTPKSIEAWRPRIEQIAEELLDEVGNVPAFDLMEAVAVPLPVMVIAEMIGVPSTDRARFKAWSDALARTLEPTITPEQFERARSAREEIGDYFGRIIDERRAEPREDLVSVLIAAEDAGDKLTREETIATLTLLLAAGNETTTNLIGNGMLHLMRHPDQLHWLRRNPDATDAAVEELLRFDSPVQTNVRVVLEDTEVAGQPLKRGETLVLLQGAGNRDPQRFERPDEFDVTRGDRHHLSFGRGIHHCIGAPLARLEAQVIFPRLLQRFPAIRLAAEPRFRDQVVLRGLERLDVRVDEPAKVTHR